MFLNETDREKQRRLVVQAVFFIYALSLLEGALRKWLLPGLAGPLTLLRDPFVIALYGYCLSKGLIMRHGIAKVWLGFAVFTSCFGLVQYIGNDFVLILNPGTGRILAGWMFGIRSYWLYLPLAFVVAATFRLEDIIRFLKFNLWLALPYAMLVANQYGAGPTAFINRGVGGDEASAVPLGHLDIVRPFGLFTYTAPNVHFTAAMLAMFLAVSFIRQQEQPNKLIFLIMGIAVGTMTVLTGSRYIFFAAGVIFAFTLLGLMWTHLNSRTVVRILYMVFFFVLAGWLLAEIFPDMLVAMELRVERAARAEGSWWNRIYYSGFSFLDALGTAPIFGHGIGAGAPGVARFLNLPPLLYGEADTQRNINELGIIFGSIFLLMRWFTSFWLLKTALKLSREGLPIVLPLAGFAAFPLVIAQITHSPLISFLPWLFFGLVLAYRNNLMIDSPPSHLTNPESIEAR
jgi:hypothetical protein